MWTKSKVHQRRVKGRRLSDLCFRVLADGPGRPPSSLAHAFSRLAGA